MTDSELEKKAAAGDNEAQFSLAVLYEIGLDRPVDLPKAAAYWKMAAKDGRTWAIDRLQQLVAKGKIDASWLPPSLARKSPPQMSANNTQDKGKVILIAPMSENTKLISETLHEAGYRLLEALDGQDGLQKIMANPDLKLIVTDCDVPKLNGMQLIKTLRRMQIVESAKVLMLTADAQPELIARGKQLRIDSWLITPVARNLIRDTAARLLDRKVLR